MHVCDVSNYGYMLWQLIPYDLQTQDPYITHKIEIAEFKLSCK